MPVSDEPRWLRPGLLLEIFVLLNLGFLTFDIYLAHSVNGFRQRPEYIPLYIFPPWRLFSSWLASPFRAGCPGYGRLLAM